LDLQCSCLDAANCLTKISGRSVINTKILRPSSRKVSKHAGRVSTQPFRLLQQLQDMRLHNVLSLLRSCQNGWKGRRQLLLMLCSHVPSNRQLVLHEQGSREGTSSARHSRLILLGLSHHAHMYPVRHLPGGFGSECTCHGTVYDEGIRRGEEGGVCGKRARD